LYNKGKGQRVTNLPPQSHALPSSSIRGQYIPINVSIGLTNHSSEKATPKLCMQKSTEISEVEKQTLRHFHYFIVNGIKSLRDVNK
jgi:hypothetical protein